MSKSEWDNAPWNESELPEEDFYINVAFTVQKDDVVVTTNDYTPEQILRDEQIVEPLDTSATDWEQAYIDNDHLNIIELLDKLKGYIIEDMERSKDDNEKMKKLKHLLKECDGWSIEDSYYEYE